MTATVAALFVQRNGIYWGRDDVDAWDESRDARLYDGELPVVAHPPCQRWGRYWSGGPSAKVRRKKGDDGGCFSSALASIRRCGGILEHPEATHAFDAHWLPRPLHGSWQRSTTCGGWVTQVAQSAYGHVARKLTWLYYFGSNAPPRVDWSTPKGAMRLDAGFRSNEERRRARENGIAPIKTTTTKQNEATPPAFAELLLSIARGAN